MHGEFALLFIGAVAGGAGAFEDGLDEAGVEGGFRVEWFRFRGRGGSGWGWWGSLGGFDFVIPAEIDGDGGEFLVEGFGGGFGDTGLPDLELFEIV